MEPSRAHLTEEELDRLLEDATNVEDDRVHARECAECGHRLMVRAEGVNILRSLQNTAQPGGSGCPRPEIWWEIAAGISPDPPELLEHAASCEVCGPELKAALEAQTDKPSELDLYTSPLESASPRADLGRRMAARWSRDAAVTVMRRARWRVLRYAAFAAMLVAMIGGAILLYRGPSTKDLIARAYQEKRTVDFRLPEAGYAALRVERGASEERTNRTLPLLEAEASVTKNLLKHPDDPVLLHQKAQVELLNWDYDSALRHLLRASELRPDNSEILEDVALAYYERAKKEGRAVDFGASVEALGKILDRQPDDRTALFNRAIALEQMMLYREAVKDWEHFLKLESKGGWAEEARERLMAIQKKLQARERIIRPCADLNAEMILTWQVRGTLPVEIERFEGGWSCLREHALTGWLAGAALNNPEARRALTVAGNAIGVATGDTWFRDLMQGSGAGRFGAAAMALSEAVAANLAADSGRAESAALTAQKIFVEIGNDAGVAQSTIEYDYAIRRAQRPAECMATLAPLERRTLRQSWVWTSLQARLEKATCLGLAGDQTAEKRLAQEVTELTWRQAHAGLHLRALSYLEGAEILSTEGAAAWEHASEGLREFWLGHESAVWGYQIYYLLTIAATATGRNHLALHLQRETLAEIKRAGRPSAEAFTWFDYGRTALRAGATAEARTAFTTASRLYAALPRDRALTTVLADCDVYLAQIDLLNHRPTDALARLKPIATEMERGNSFAMELWYRRAVAQADQQLGRTAKYQTDLQEVVETSERILAKLTTLREQTEWARENGDTYRELAAAYALDRKHPERALDAWEWFRAAPFRGLGSPVGSSVASLAESGITQAIIYVALENRLLIWYVRGGSIKLRTVAVSRSHLESISRTLYMLCSDPQTSDKALKRLARELTRYLVTPIEDDVAWDQPLWIEPDDALAPTPFPVLPLRGGDPLGVVSAIAIFPGVEYLKESKRPHAFESNEPMLSVGVVSALGQQFVPLPGAIEEANEVARHFPATKVLLDEQATRGNIERDLPGAVVIHFAGHLRESAAKGALLLAGNGKVSELDAEEMAAMNLERCRLVVISACSAEAPEFFEESRPFGFSLGLLRAGVPGVVATRWDLDSRTALEFMKVFYQLLASGDSARHATWIAAARIRNAPRTSHPYYWVAYQFFGRG